MDNKDVIVKKNSTFTFHIPYGFCMTYPKMVEELIKSFSWDTISELLDFNAYLYSVTLWKEPLTSDNPSRTIKCGFYCVVTPTAGGDSWLYYWWGLPTPNLKAPSERNLGLKVTDEVEDKVISIRESDTLFEALYTHFRAHHPDYIVLLEIELPYRKSYVKWAPSQHYVCTVELASVPHNTDWRLDVHVFLKTKIMITPRGGVEETKDTEM